MALPYPVILSNSSNNNSNYSNSSLNSSNKRDPKVNTCQWLVTIDHLKIHLLLKQTK